MNGSQELVSQIERLQQQVTRDRGVEYFALVERRDVPDSWDLVISAPWARANKRAALDYLVQLIKSQLGAAVLLKLARIVILDNDDPKSRAYERRLQARAGRPGVYMITPQQAA